MYIASIGTEVHYDPRMLLRAGKTGLWLESPQSVVLDLMSFLHVPVRCHNGFYKLLDVSWYCYIFLLNRQQRLDLQSNEKIYIMWRHKFVSKFCTSNSILGTLSRVFLVVFFAFIFRVFPLVFHWQWRQNTPNFLHWGKWSQHFL